MRKLWIVIKREYLTRVRTKTFVFTTIALPLFGIGSFVLVAVLAARQVSHTVKLAIVDETGQLGDAVKQRLDEKLPNGQPLFDVTRVLEPSGGQARDMLNELMAQVRSRQLDGYLVIPRGVLKGEEAEFHTENVGALTLIGSIRQAVSDAVIAARLSRRGIRVQDLNQLVGRVDIRLFKIAQHGESVERGQTFVIGVAVTMILYMTLLVYGMTTMRSVVEEKTTRIVEILVSAVRPTQLLAGKIIGVAGVALTQYLIWGLSAALLFGYGATMASTFLPGAPPVHLHVPPAVLIYAVVFFLAGYFLYASLYAALGAMVSTEQDMQQVQMPVTLLVFVAFFLFQVILNNPNSTTSVILSMIPFFAPMLMVLRIAIEMPPFWQIALSVVLLALTTLGVLQISARIYRVGILMYGKRPSVAELLRWLRYT